MTELFERINETTEFIRSRYSGTPRAGLILGTGLDVLAGGMVTDSVFPYEELPYFAPSTAPGHRGRLLCGELAGCPVVAMQGRVHAYEGHSFRQITFPVRVMQALGCELLIVTSASGGVNPDYASGDILIVDDHINLMSGNPLTGPNDERLGPRFPDMSRPYDADLIQRAETICRSAAIRAHRGTYVGMRGPNYETPAEYRFLQHIGGDVAGMSTVPEAIVAAHAGLRVLALSTVTNVFRPGVSEPTDAQQVIDIARRAATNVQSIILGVLREDAGVG